MAPNNMKLNNPSDNSIESVLSSDSPTRRCRSMSMASQASSGEQHRGSKTRHGIACCEKKPQQQRKSSSLPVETVEYLKAWMMSPEHISHPYPTDQEKAQIMADTGIELKQLTNWFVNNRKRYWKPRVEARLQHQHQQQRVSAVAIAAAAAAAVGPTANTTGNSVSLLQQQQTTVSYLLSSPPTAISFMSLDNMAQVPITPVSIKDSIDQPSVVSLASTPVDIKPTTSFLSSSEPISAVTAENLAAFLNPSPATAVPSSPQTVSELSSSSSDVGSVDCSSSSTSIEQDDNRRHLGHNFVSSESSSSISASDDNLESGDSTISHIETVDVHILRPSRNGRTEPSIEDVTILPNVPATRILRTFPTCALTYHNNNTLSRANRKRMQSRRDAEIVRIKKHYLRCYLTEREAIEASSSHLGKRVCAVIPDVEDSSHNSSNYSIQEQQEPDETTMSTSPRLKYRRICSNPDDYWRLICQAAVHPHDEGLPSLEEAACMFGFAATTAIS